MVSTRAKRLSGASEEDASQKATLSKKTLRPGITNNDAQDKEKITGLRPSKRQCRETSTTGRTSATQNSLTLKPTTTDTQPETKENHEASSLSALVADGANSDSTISSPPSPLPVSRTVTNTTPVLSNHNGHTEASDRPLLQNRGHQVLQEPVPQDIGAVLDAILNHSRRVDEIIQQYKADWGEIDTSNLPMVEASLRLKIQSLSILDNLATQILDALAKSSYAETVMKVTHPESEGGQAYASLKTLFDHTRKVYSARGHFLDSTKLGLLDITHIETVRKANLATFVSSIFGSRDVGFYYLNEYFLDTFVSNGNRLLKSQAQLFLDLKTQAYISAMSSGEHSREEILNDIFPSDLEQRLLSRRHGAKQLAPSETDFISRARNRSKGLSDEPDTKEAIAALPGKYDWEDFLKEVSSYVSKNFDTILGVDPVRNDLTKWSHLSSFTERGQKRSPAHGPNNLPAEHFRQQLQPRRPSHSQSILYQPQLQPSTDNGNGVLRSSNTDETTGKAAPATHFTVQGFGTYLQQSNQPNQNNHPSPQNFAPHQFSHSYQFSHPLPSSDPYQQMNPHAHPRPPQYPFDYQLPPFQVPPPPGYYHPHPHPQMIGPPHVFQHQHMYPDHNGIPYPTQSAPTQVLYERARMVATAKSVPTSRRAGNASQRRPWSTEEENALMAGLDRVKGPHWSQILAMFGPGGTINESLKDRNQVQLKDKARNLKLFFLKSGIEVPYYLQFVTGELKTRAPAQAAKNEEKTKSDASEEPGLVDTVIGQAGSPVQMGWAMNIGPENGTTHGPCAVDGTADSREGEIKSDSAAENSKEIPNSSIGAFHVNNIGESTGVLPGTEDSGSNRLQHNAIQSPETTINTDIPERPPPALMLMDAAKEAALRTALLAAQTAAMDTTNE